MVHLTTVVGSFHAHVLKARLGSEGISVELRGLSEGPYPIQVTVAVYVRGDELELARSLLLADAVEAAFEESCGDVACDATDALDLKPADLPALGRLSRGRTALVLAMVGLIVLVGVVSSFH
jgi:hypothetical protein